MSIARITKRFHSTSSDATVAAQLLKERTHKPLVRQQHFDANQLKLLTATLSRGNPSSITMKIPIPACYHLAYLTPCQFEEQLGADGTDRTFNPPAPFTRRMWAGGEVQWLFDEDRGLKIGDLVVERTSLTSIEPKMTRKGEEMLVVGVEKTYRASWSRGISVIDKRNWLFLPEITTPVPPLPTPPIVPFPTGAHHRDLLQTPVSLFRFSALTFNGHKIHYNREWCREVEGHRDLVVHGPLNLIHIMDFWKDVKFRDIPTQLPKKVTYRATNPIYVGEKYRIVMEDERNGLTEVRIVDSYGVTCMVATIESR